MKNSFNSLQKNPVLFAALLACLLWTLPGSGIAQLPADTQEWKSDEVAEGIYLESYHGKTYYNSAQSIKVLHVDLKTAGVIPAFAGSDSELIKTSEFAERNNAIAAVNGSFFDVSAGGSVVFFKEKGEVLHPGAENRRRYNENGGIAIDESGNISIVERPEEGWRTIKEPNLLSSGPLLISEGETQTFNNDPFNQNRHPRTAVGITDTNRLLLVTVDGRSDQAHGMSIPEFAELMESLGAENALNLDGGGSTTMWIKGNGEDGIINHPSDNGYFDHSGERGVANTFLLIPGN